MKFLPQGQPTTSPEKDKRVIGWWLFGLFLAVGAMVLLGGLTRLTGSGLSMVEWRPLFGVLPPLSEPAWQRTFKLYQGFPQFQQVNSWMTLADFKQIFFWEWLHRLWGRLIGVFFLLPWLYFWLRGRLRGLPQLRLILAFVLGGLQGALGWFMVRSGLVDIPSVSHLRLAAHLILAFFVSGWLLWLALDLWEWPRVHSTGKERRWLYILAVLVPVQIVWGAFMAGTKAGFLYSGWPGLAGSWHPTVPDSGLSFSLLLYNPLWIHWMHRSLALVLLIGSLLLIGQLWKRPEPEIRPLAGLLALAILVQYGLGVLTVLSGVSLAVAVAHQGGGLVLFAAVLVVLRALTGGKGADFVATIPARMQPGLDGAPADSHQN